MSAKHRPFIVFGLPRSRTAWLSVFLDVGSRCVGHDIGIGCRSPEHFIDRLRGELDGTCETGAAFAWPLIAKAVPDARVVVVRRNPVDVAERLGELGLGHRLPEMLDRSGHLRVISCDLRTLTVDYDDLASPDTCRAVWEHCLDQPWDEAWWRHMDTMNVQVDLRRRVAALVANANRIAGLKAEVSRRMCDA